MTTRLRLSLTGAAPDLADHVGTWECTEAGGTIGRSSRNDWVLPDPTKVVSGRHAEIRCEDGRFSLIDHSTNGVFLNGAEFPIGDGHAAALHHGDRLRIGDFEILAELATEPLPTWQIQPSTDPKTLIPWDFGGSQGTTEPDPGGDVHVNLGDLGHLAPPPAESEGDSPPTNPTLPWDIGGGPDDAATAVAPEDTGLSGLSGFGPPFIASGGEPPQARATANGPRAEPRQPPGSGDPPREPIRHPTLDPTLPNAVPAPATGLASPVPTAPPGGPPPRRQAPRAQPHADADWPPASRPGANPSVTLAPPSPPRPSRPCDDGAAGPPADGLEQALAALLAGAGVPDLPITGGATPELFRSIGELLGLYTTGAVDLVRTISVIKNTFRIEQTQVQSRDNNPLRWATPRQALKHLLAPAADDDYLPPIAAVADAMAGVMAHQMGVIRGMEAAFKSFVQDLAPEELERRFETQGGRRAWTTKKAWYWEQYAKHYRQLAEDAEDNYLDLLGAAFLQAYERQVRAIRASANERTGGPPHP